MLSKHRWLNCCPCDSGQSDRLSADKATDTAPSELSMGGRGWSVFVKPRGFLRKASAQPRPPNS